MHKSFRIPSAVVVAVLTLFFALHGAHAAKKKSSTVTIVNQSSWEIHYLYFSPTGDWTWGPDQLGDDDTIDEGDSLQIQKIPCDTYDVKLIDEDDDECIIEEVRLCSDNERWVITDRELLACQGNAAPSATNLTIVNNSGWELFELYVSPSDEWDWGDDQLDDETIDTGESFTLSGVPCGDYDVKLIDEDDDECVVEDVDVCDGSGRWVITSADLLACQWE